MFASTNACTVLGSSAIPVEVEVSVNRGLPNLTIIGMRQADANEARERIRCGMASLGIDLGLNRIVVSIAPADLPKSGAALDLPIAIGILAALGHIKPARAQNVVSHGELGLDGTIRCADGVVAAAFASTRINAKEFIVSSDNASKASLAPIPVIPVTSLKEVISYLKDELVIPAAKRAEMNGNDFKYDIDLSDVRAQRAGIEALLVAAAGGHNLLFFGEPGCGKTMLAHRLPTILPNLDAETALEVATIHDSAGLRERNFQLRPPFRMPHHTVSTQALVGGGGSRPIVGEVTLAHRGVLFLDELPEFRPSAIDSLRQPLEDKEVRIRRAGWIAKYPCATQLIAAMNLCKCGRSGTSSAAGGCTCSDAMRAAYSARVSGAIVDRFDIRVRMKLKGSIVNSAADTDSESATKKVLIARARQKERWSGATLNSEIQNARNKKFNMKDEARTKLDTLVSKAGGAGRVQRAAVRVARTLADLDDRDSITSSDIIDAFSLCRSTPGAA